MSAAWSPGAAGRAPPGPVRLVAMGASTGGPAAVRQVLRELGPDFPVPVLLVIHLSEAFDTSMAAWLGTQSGLPVQHPRDGQPLPAPGQPGVWLAPAARHLAVRAGRLRLEAGPERHSCRPSVDVLFESLADEGGHGVVACLLTGMGRDGAQGLAALRRAGATTLAQDEASCVVFGMPQEAIRLGAASHVLGLQHIGPWLRARTRQHIDRRTL